MILWAKNKQKLRGLNISFFEAKFFNDNTFIDSVNFEILFVSFVRIPSIYEINLTLQNQRSKLFASGLPHLLEQANTRNLTILLGDIYFRKCDFRRISQILAFSA